MAREHILLTSYPAYEDDLLVLIWFSFLFCAHCDLSMSQVHHKIWRSLGENSQYLDPSFHCRHADISLALAHSLQSRLVQAAVVQPQFLSLASQQPGALIQLI